VLAVLGVVTLAVTIGVGVTLIAGLASLPALADTDRRPGRQTVSIVVAARNEVEGLSRALPSLLAQDHPVEVVVVDDRSSDGTSELLDHLEETEPSLRVEHIRELPDGWLGKNHALQRGAELATGELLLFTDADVIMQPDAVGRAVGLMEELGVAHLAVSPRMHTGTVGSTMVLSVFLVLFALVFRPWRAADPGTRAHIGIGAFNLVRAKAYHRIGGHRSVALRPDDDVRLGRELKRAGTRQAAASGQGCISVQWYASLPEMARGLRKNVFAVVDYRLSMVVAGTLIPVLLVFWPVTALLLTDGLVWWLNAGTVAAGMVTHSVIARPSGLPLWVGPAYPLGSVLLLWIVWAATLRALRTGTIEWRGTHYPLDQLR
jgi:cellulose synthase/poly-beta-1,6-N-acetylglucosamine synthase-like glycosyltransferase